MKFKSALLTQVSGSIGGMTAAHNKSGMYLRARNIPVNPNTASQVNARGAFAAAAQMWSTSIDDIERDTWRFYAAGTPVVNSLGDTVHLSGFNWYVATNAFLMGADQPDVGSAPDTVGIGPQILGMAINADVSSQDFTGVSIELNTALTATQLLRVWVSNPVSAGTLFYKGPWNEIYTAMDPATNFVGITAGAPWPLTTGSQLFYRARIIDTADRKLGPEFIFGPRGTQP